MSLFWFGQGVSWGGHSMFCVFMIFYFYVLAGYGSQSGTVVYHCLWLGTILRYPFSHLWWHIALGFTVCFVYCFVVVILNKGENVCSPRCTLVLILQQLWHISWNTLCCLLLWLRWRSDQIWWPIFAEIQIFSRVHILFLDTVYSSGGKNTQLSYFSKSKDALKENYSRKK